MKDGFYTTADRALLYVLGDRALIVQNGVVNKITLPVNGANFVADPADYWTKDFDRAYSEAKF